MILFPKAWKYKVTHLAPVDVDKKFDEFEDAWWKMSEIRENVKNLVAKNNMLPKHLDNILHLRGLSNRKKYREFLKRRDNFLENHQLMDANEFAQLFWSEDLKNKGIVDAGLISGKYNKADIHQWILGLCIFDTFLQQLKETPFFETLMRCSLQRNKRNDWWECLIPFCNNEWKYEEISDEDINYLKNTEFEGKKLISESSLWFNILEALLVKMIWNSEKYPHLSTGHLKFQLNRNKPRCYDDFKKLSPDDLHGITFWVNEVYARDYFLWKGKAKEVGWISDFNDEELRWLINLAQSWILKLRTWTTDEKIHNYIQKNIPNLWNESLINSDMSEDSNEKFLNERWYPLKILYEAWAGEEVSIWKAKELWVAFKIEWTKEWFVQWHAYSIAGMHKRDWETFVTIINPWYTWKKIDVPFKYIKEFFYINAFWFDIDTMFIEENDTQKIN